MKLQHVLPLAAVATAAVVSDDLTGRRQLVLHEENRHDSLWESLPGRKDIMSSIEDMFDNFGRGVDEAMDAIARTGRRMIGSLLDEHESYGNRRGRHHGGLGGSESVFDIIRNSHNAREFAKLIEEHKDIRDYLEKSSADVTVFVPTDDAFKKLSGHDLSSKEMVEMILRYHIVPEPLTVGRIMTTHTLPTSLKLKELGDWEQRLRVSVGLFGIHLNFYSQVVASNIMGSNGIVHVVDNVLIPPPRQGKLIEALPGKFSTFTLALEKTGLADELRRIRQRGGTMFAPTNAAFDRLGPKTNAFLFSDKGTKYLRALLEYHVVLNETLYSDTFYPDRKDRGDKHRGDDERDGERDNELDVLMMTHADRSSRRHRGSRRSPGHHRRCSPWDPRCNERQSGRHGRRHGGNAVDAEDFCSPRDPRWPDCLHSEDYCTPRDPRWPDCLHSEDYCSPRHPNFPDCAHSEEWCSPRHPNFPDCLETEQRCTPENPDFPFCNTVELARRRSHRRHGKADPAFFDRDEFHMPLVTMLDDLTVNVDITTWMGITTMSANSRVGVSVLDGIARDGVIQVVSSVLMPPRHRRHSFEDDLEDNYEDDSLSVSELRRRLRSRQDDDDEDRKDDDEHRRRKGRKDEKNRKDDREDRDREDRDRDDDGKNDDEYDLEFDESRSRQRHRNGGYKGHRGNNGRNHHNGRHGRNGRDYDL